MATLTLKGSSLLRSISSVWRFAEALDYGIVGINEGMTSIEIAPFSGVGKNENGRDAFKCGLDDYLEIKYLCAGI